MQEQHLHEINWRKLGYGAIAGLGLGASSPDGFTDDPKKVIEKRLDIALGFEIKELDANTVQIIYNPVKLNDEKALDRAIVRLPGGYNKWNIEGSQEISGTNKKILILRKK